MPCPENRQIVRAFAAACQGLGPLPCTEGGYCGDLSNSPAMQMQVAILRKMLHVSLCSLARKAEASLEGLARRYDAYAHCES